MAAVGLSTHSLNVREGRDEVRVASVAELDKKVQNFICRLVKGTKKELNCRFTDNPKYSFTIEQSFGALSGEKEEMASENYVCDSSILDGHPDPRDTLREGVRLKEGLEVNCTRTPTPVYTYPLHALATRQQINVGWGNTLAFYSSINDWKEPFKMVCVDDDLWNGLLPVNHEYKYVKIDSEGHVTWEKDVPCYRYYDKNLLHTGNRMRLHAVRHAPSYGPIVWDE